MQLVDRIEKRRFVGREFLLWLWFESELFDATLSTREHGSFGLWLEKRLVLSEGRESTRITAPMPGLGREAKEALLRGQLPESAGLRLALGDEETSFVLKAESLAVSGLKLPTLLGQGDEPSQNDLLDEILGRGGQRGRSKATRGEPQAGDEQVEAFYERMRLTTDFEGLLESLYRDFIALRLSGAWEQSVVPLLRTWASGGGELDIAAYERLRRPSEAPLPEAHATTLDLTPLPPLS